MPQITISYRREDSGAITGRICDRLIERFGGNAIFRDIDSLPYGGDFKLHFEGFLHRSDVVLAIVGQQWIGPRGGPDRLADPDDWVRLDSASSHTNLIIR